MELKHKQAAACIAGAVCVGIGTGSIWVGVGVFFLAYGLWRG